MAIGEVILLARDVTKAFNGAARAVLQGVSLEARGGERIVIVGHSGAGKTTLLNVLGGLDRPTSGVVEILGRDLARMNEAQLARVRGRDVGFVFQAYHLIGDFSALENVMAPQLILGASRRAAQEKAILALEAVGLGGFARRRPDKLSGGERQRVAIARALINDPRILLADEPTGNLDEHTGAEIVDLLWRQADEHERAVIMVAHEPSIARRAGRLLQLDQGRLIETKV